MFVVEVCGQRPPARLLRADTTCRPQAPRTTFAGIWIVRHTDWRSAQRTRQRSTSSSRLTGESAPPRPGPGEVGQLGGAGQARVEVVEQAHVVPLELEVEDRVVVKPASLVGGTLFL